MPLFALVQARDIILQPTLPNSICVGLCSHIALSGVDGKLTECSPKRKRLGVKASNSVESEPTGDIGRAFNDCSTKQNVGANISSVNLRVPLTAQKKRLQPRTNLSHNPPWCGAAILFPLNPLMN